MKIKQTVSELKKAHQFFVRETPSFVGRLKFGEVNSIIEQYCTDENLRISAKKQYKLSLRQKFYYPLLT